ncbi:MAG: hypothetical protein CMO61_00445 [Verrucomicrobiales bacterium]|jgi:hypothetical protein|nr:hypothetical protein [Verrucomicrobiales bacterium]
MRLFGEDKARQELFTSCRHQQKGLLTPYLDFASKISRSVRFKRPLSGKTIESGFLTDHSLLKI